METILNLAISFFTGVGICCTGLFLLGKFKKPTSNNVKIDFSKHELPDWIKYDRNQYIKPIELPADKFKLYYLGEFICEIERKDIKKVKDVYDLEEIKLILNIQ